MRLNTRLLKKVRDTILEKPNQLNMEQWFDADYGAIAQSPLEDCGTTACIAGWVCTLKGWAPAGEWVVVSRGGAGQGPRDPQSLAAELLGGLSPNDSTTLFYLKFWPPKFSRAYARATTPRGRAAATARRIDHFIATGT